MGWIGCVLCEIFQHNFVARSFALIALVRPILNRVSYGNETIPEAPQHHKTQQNMRLGSNRVDRVHSLRKILTRIRGTDFCIDCTSSAHFDPSFVRHRNGPESIQTQQNAPKHEFIVQWVGSGAFVTKSSNTISLHELLH